MIEIGGLTDQRYAVLGLGRSGLAVARALSAGGVDVVVWDDNEQARIRAADDDLDVQDLNRVDWATIDCLITSPGIPHLYPKPHPIIAAALQAGVVLDNDVGLFFQFFAQSGWAEFDQEPKIVAVTGSNGKSTTSALIHHVLKASGRPTQLAGNIGLGVFDLDPAHDGEVIVLELSSYQTELARSLTPDVGVWTNISADHLDRHGGMGGYVAAKRRLFIEGGPDRAIIGVDEVEGQFLANQLSQARVDDRVIRISAHQKLDGPGWYVFARKGFLSEYRKTRQVASIDLRNIAGLPGVHNHQNACAAYGALRTLGLSPRVIEEGFKSFAGLAHRSQFVREINGVRYINDSKATNIDAAAKALQAFKNIRWICGGLMKEGGVDALHDIAKTSVKKAYVIGREAAEFARQIGITAEVCTTMQAAVQAAARDAETGDTVLLAPAAASFDQYDNFEMRGLDFIDHTHAITG